MDSFDQSITDCISDSVNATTYRPDGSGYWSNGLPCLTCGSISVVLDPVPACVVCTHRVEDADIAVELLSQHLDTLNRLAPRLPAEAKRALRHQAHTWAVHLHKLLLSTADES